MTKEEIHSIVSTPEFRRFSNALRILISLDAHEVPFIPHSLLRSFFGNPYRFFLRADDENAALIWKAIEARQTLFDEPLNKDETL